MSMATAGALPRKVTEAALVLLSLFIGYLVIEVGYRAYLYFTFAVKANYAVNTIDANVQRGVFGTPGSVTGAYVPNSKFTLTQHDINDKAVLRSVIQINNFGWVSRYDYSRKKTPGEYRIAIVGDSLTASVNNNYPWPDVVQRKFDEDRDLLAMLGLSRISVLNLGVAGASMQFMANPLALIARRFSSDMIVVNFIIEDLQRRHSSQFDIVPREPTEPPSEIEAADPPQNDVSIDGVEIRLFCPRGTPRALSNPECRVSPLWYVASGRNIEGPELTRLKQILASRLLLHRVLLSMRPLALLDLLGHPIIGRAQAQGETIKSGEDEDVDIGLRVLKFISGLASWHVAVTHNPLYWHLTGTARPPVLDRFVALAAQQSTPIVRMEEYMPTQRGEREWYRWYNLPHDGHWSDYGAEVYGDAMYRLLRARLIAQLAPALVTDVNVCGASYQSFQDGRLALAGSDAAKAEKAFDSAISKLRADSLKLAPSASYAECGFVGELYAERALLREQRGAVEEADADWQLAMKLLPNAVPMYLRQITQRKARGDTIRVIAGLHKLIELLPDDVNLRVARGDALLAKGEPAAALVDFEAASKKSDRDVSLLFRMAQARLMTGDYSGATKNLDVALSITPDNASLLFSRASAKGALQNWAGALDDLNKAIALMPKQPEFYLARANAFDRLGRKSGAEADRKTAASLK
jgi:tetratricopeptide (TPR) repeat protein